MKKLLNKLFRTKPKWEFHPAELQETTEQLKNPARGWYTIYPFLLEEEPDFKELFWCLRKKETLALVIINIGAYRELRLDVQALKRIRSILSFFRQHSYDVILRLTYDHEGNAVEREPFFFKQVAEHMEQLAPVIKEFSDVIFISQGLLIGNWGEMHTSRFVAPEKMKHLWGILQYDLHKGPYLAVRRPSMWRILHPESCGKPELKVDTTGLFDDAMFGSDSHMGTFGIKSKESAGWEENWSRKDELEFEYELCKYVPNGGEVVCGENYTENFTPESTLEVLRQMHVTYLNQAYDEKILNLWKQWNWQNGSFYDYVGQHLGYRFVIRNVEVLPEEQKNKLSVIVSIENTGFANCYQEAEVMLERIDVLGRQEIFKFATDIRTWDSGTTKRISCIIDMAVGELYLRVCRKSDDRMIYFANRTEETGRVYLGELTEL